MMEQLAARIRTVKVELLSLIDPGADDDYVLSVLQGDVAKWYDELDAIELAALSSALREGE